MFNPTKFEDRGDNTFYFADEEGNSIVLNRDSAEYPEMKAKFDEYAESQKSQEGKEPEADEAPAADAPATPSEEAPAAPAEPENAPVSDEVPTDEEAKLSYEGQPETPVSDAPAADADAPADAPATDEAPIE